MYEVHNKISVASDEHAKHLEAAFAQSNQRMAAIPGFREFHLLRSQDGGHYLVRVLWESEAHFKGWVQSDHFKRAHQGQNTDGASAELSQYEVVI